ncbi:corepressor interacting with RBPJ 1-like isoform X1 [Sycon ciliatum]|uniref:corepressor interacting with RBPJ 1-like isoform X1 n=1 Tax=Sycon ciliatum TaxID=27933 RepID=UPI0031F62DE6
MSFQKFMNKKDFHPGSFRNIKMAWEAEEKTRLSKEKEDNMRTQYDREQELYRNRQQMAGGGRDKLQLNFMYDLPPGMKREEMERQEEDPELGPDGLPRLKLEKKKSVPAITDKDGAVASASAEPEYIGSKRHVQCYRCSKWGHANTDKICPMYNVPRDEDRFIHRADPMKLIREMHHDGFAFNRSLYGGVINVAQRGQELIISDDDNEEDGSRVSDDMAIVASLNKEQKRRLLKKLENVEDVDNVNITQLLAAAAREEKEASRNVTESHQRKSKKSRKHKKQKKSSKSSESGGSDSDDDSSQHVSRSKTTSSSASSRHHHKHRRRSHSSCSDSRSRSPVSSSSKRSRHGSDHHHRHHRHHKHTDHHRSQRRQHDSSSSDDDNDHRSHRRSREHHSERSEHHKSTSSSSSSSRRRKG